MFREMRRKNQALSPQECARVLSAAPRGVLAVHGENGYPYAFPMDFLWLDGAVYFHCAREGHKLDAVAADDRVSFCVMDEGFRREGEWALNIRSVILFGRLAPVEDRDRARELTRQLGLKYYPTPQSVEEELARDFHRVQVLKLQVEHMSGKLVNES